MSNAWIRVFFLFVLAVVSIGSIRSTELRIVEGSVEDKRGNRLPGAVVYLENTATLVIKTFVVQRDGNYHFDQLNPDVDYTLVARYKKYESKQRRLSEFNSARRSVIDLVIPAE